MDPKPNSTPAAILVFWLSCNFEIRYPTSIARVVSQQKITAPWVYEVAMVSPEFLQRPVSCQVAYPEYCYSHILVSYLSYLNKFVPIDMTLDRKETKEGKKRLLLVLRQRQWWYKRCKSCSGILVYPLYGAGLRWTRSLWAPLIQHIVVPLSRKSVAISKLLSIASVDIQRNNILWSQWHISQLKHFWRASQ